MATGSVGGASTGGSGGTKSGGVTGGGNTAPTGSNTAVATTKNSPSGAGVVSTGKGDTPAAASGFKAEATEPSDGVALTPEAAGQDAQSESVDALTAAWSQGAGGAEENKQAGGPAKTLSAEEQAQVQEYEQQAQRHQELISEIEADVAAGVYMAGTTDDPRMLEFADLNRSISGIRGDFDEALGVVQEEASAVRDQAEMQLQAEAQTGQLMSETERTAFGEFADQRMAEVAAPLDDATQNLVETMQDPVFQANFQDWSPERQQQFFQDMASTMPLSPTGQEWVSQFNDGLAELGREGTTDNPFAEVAGALRADLPPEQAAELDGALGLMVGTDQSLRTDGAEGRLSDIGEALDIPEDDLAAFPREGHESNPAGLPSAPGSLYGAGPFANAAALAYNTFQASNQDWSSNNAFANASTIADLSSGAASLMNLGDDFSRLGRFSGAASRMSAYLSFGSAAQHALEGDFEEAIPGALGAAGALAGVTPVGLALTAGSLIAGPLMDQAEYANFVHDGVSHVMGEDFMNSQRGIALATAPPEGVTLLGQTMPEGMTMPEYFNQRLDSWAGADLGPSYWQFETQRLQGMLQLGN